MSRVHIGLDLEDEPREVFGGRVDAGASQWRRCHLDELIQKELDAEVRDGAAEEDRRNFALQHRATIETLTGAVKKLNAFVELFVDRFAHQSAQPGVGRIRNGNRCTGRAVCGALEAVHRLAVSVVDAAELFAAAEWPVHRKGADAEHALQLVEEFERIAARAIHLIHESEERDAALAANRKELFSLRLDAL